MDAKKKVHGWEKAQELLAGAKTLYAAKGKKMVTVDLLAERPDETTLRGLMLGPTGNLRAPLLVVGDAVMVGFDEETYRRLFG